MVLAYLFLKINILRFEPCFQSGDFFIRLHIFECQCNLVCNLLQEFDIFVGEVTYLPAGDGKNPNTIAADKKRHDAVRSHAFSGEMALIRILLFILQVSANEGRPMVEDPANTVALTTNLSSLAKII